MATDKQNNLSFLPVNIRITDRKILIIGGGKVAAHKAAILNRFTNDITILSPSFDDKFKSLSLTCIEKPYETGDLAGYQLIYICTNNPVLNRRIKEEAKEAGILASVCDAPALCDLTSPAIYRHENLTISIATDGKEVKRAIAIRDRIAQLIENGILLIE